MNKIKFSIIVPIYNTELYLKKCLNSIVKQSYKNIEIILVNDGSEDESPTICDEYGKIDSRIQIIHKKNGGVSDTRNHGLIKATGQYVMFVDSDDYIEKDCCKKFSKIIKNHPKVDIIASNIKSFSSNKIKKEMYTLTDVKQPLNGREFLKLQLKNKTIQISSCRNIYNRKYIIDNQFFFKVGILHEDEQWTPRVFLLAKRVICTEYTHYIRVQREGSITRNKVKTKNAIDLMEIVIELSITYEGLEDIELKKLLYDYLVMLYLNAFCIGKMYQPKYKKYINKTFLKNNALSVRNRRKVALFCFDVRIYYITNKLLRMIYHAFKLASSIIPSLTVPRTTQFRNNSDNIDAGFQGE